MIRTALLLSTALLLLLLLLAATECAPGKPKVKKTGLLKHWWETYTTYTTPDYYKSTPPPVTETTEWYETTSPPVTETTEWYEPTSPPVTETTEWYETTSPPVTETTEWYKPTSPPVTETTEWYETTPPPVTETTEWYEPTSPPVTATTEWYESTGLPLVNCNTDANRPVVVSGIIGTGSQNGSYANNTHFVQVIQVPAGLKIQFTWEFFDVEGPSPSCPYDFLDISDCATGKTLTGKLCGGEIPAPVTSFSNLVVVTFSTDASVTLHGYKLEFKAISDHYETTVLETTPPNSFESTLPPGTTTSNWNEPTPPPGMRCTVSTGRGVRFSGVISTALTGNNINKEQCWLIQVPQGSLIQLMWEYFNIEGPSPGCLNDYVEISDSTTGQSLTGRICGNSIPPSVTSHSNSVVVTFISDGSVTSQRFRLRYEAVPDQYETTFPPETTTPDWYETTQQPHMKKCSADAGRVEASSGVIGVGSLNGNYSNNEQCVWEIEVPHGSLIHFMWDYFNIEGLSPGCPYDYVDITDDATGQSLTGRICGSSIPPSVTSYGNSVVVTFISDGSVTLKGFRLRFEAVSDHYETTDWGVPTQPPYTCSVDAGRVEASSGVIGVGSLNGNYSNNEQCVWEIQVPQGYSIHFMWDYLDLEGPSSGCPYDYVDITDDATGLSLTGRICGSSIPPSVTSHGNLVVVTFISDSSVTLKGFRLRFEAVSDDYETTTDWGVPTQPPYTCSVDAGRVVASSGVIGVGSLNGNYSNNEQCVWEIQVPHGSLIHFMWDYLDLEGSSPQCPFDYVRIWDYATGLSLTGRICGSSIPPSFTSHGNSVVVTFISDGSVTLKGFRLRFEAVSDDYEITTDWGVPTQPPYTCSVDAGRVVASSGVIGVGSLNGNYSNNEQCVWEIQVPHGSLIHFMWDYLDLEGSSPQCPFDYIRIWDYANGQSLTGRICGTSIPPSFTSHGNLVVVTFVSDGSVTLQGFRLRFEAVPDDYEITTDWGVPTQPPYTCSVDAGRVVASSGVIGVGSLNGNYSNNEQCVWEIQVPQGYSIHFMWDYLDLEGSSPQCPFDYVHIWDYATGQSLTGRICGSSIPPSFTSHGNLVVVTFVSDGSVTLQGFRLRFEAVPDQYDTTFPPETTADWYETTQPMKKCSVDAGRVEASSGVIGVGSLYGNYSNNEECVWEIQVPHGSLIQIMWDYFNIEGPSPGCPYDYVDVTDDATGQSLTGRICGNSIPPSVTSDSNSVVVTFISDDVITLQGFRLRFEAVPAVTATTDHYETTVPPVATTTDWYDSTTTDEGPHC
ncbi:deleted in malignant brain tumors 1 protein-like isoform X2 [Macrobrachium rosenbergii]|uniref:deleted in malignant brain tumors 1 protein-like isoform X2 n=1 Tax=Macrobrachium rosenbergii TaxID=79674 RepID=UPI0034D505D4